MPDLSYGESPAPRLRSPREQMRRFRGGLLAYTVLTIKEGHVSEVRGSKITVFRKLKCTLRNKSRLHVARASLNTFRTKQGAAPQDRRERATKTVLLF